MLKKTTHDPDDVRLYNVDNNGSILQIIGTLAKKDLNVRNVLMILKSDIDQNTIDYFDELVGKLLRQNDLGYGELVANNTLNYYLYRSVSVVYNLSICMGDQSYYCINNNIIVLMFIKFFEINGYYPTVKKIGCAYNFS
jgi:hypothetical protein